MSIPKLYVYEPQLESFRELRGYEFHKILRSYLKIPDNPTNGDMIKVLFPNDKSYSMQVSLKWWNAPYKREANNDTT